MAVWKGFHSHVGTLNILRGNSQLCGDTPLLHVNVSLPGEKASQRFKRHVGMPLNGIYILLFRRMCYCDPCVTTGLRLNLFVTYGACDLGLTELPGHRHLCFGIVMYFPWRSRTQRICWILDGSLCSEDWTWTPDDQKEPPPPFRKI